MGKKYTFEELNDRYKATATINMEAKDSRWYLYEGRRRKNVDTLIRLRKELTGEVSEFEKDRENDFVNITQNEITSEVYALHNIMRPKIDKARIERDKEKILYGLSKVIEDTQNNKLSKENRDSTTKNIAYMSQVRNNVQSSVDLDEFPFIKYVAYSNKPSIKSEYIIEDSRKEVTKASIIQEARYLRKKIKEL